MSITPKLHFQSTSMMSQGSLQSSPPSLEKAFANLNAQDQISFQSFPQKQKENLNKIATVLARTTNTDAATASTEEKQAALNAGISTVVEGMDAYNNTLKRTNNKAMANQSLVNTVFQSFSSNLNATEPGRNYFQKANFQHQKKLAAQANSLQADNTQNSTLQTGR